MFQIAPGGKLEFTGQKSGNSAGAPLNNQASASATITGGELISPYTCLFSSGDLILKNISLTSETDYWMTLKLFSGSTSYIENVTINTEKGGCLEVNGGQATLKDCTFTQTNLGNPSWNSTAVAVSSNGTVSIESGLYQGTTSAVYIYNSGGTANLNGGSYTGNDTNSTVLKADTSKTSSIINVNGGDYTGSYAIASNNALLSITNGTFSSDPEKYVKTGYKAENSNGTWTVSAESPVAQIGDKQYASLEDAVTAASVNDTIKVIDSTSLTKKLTINKNVTIDGNGKTITGNTNDAGVYIEVMGGTFNLSNATLKDFGGAVGTQSGNAVIKVPSTAAEDTKVNTTNVNVSDFNRSAYDISAGTFSITDGTIDCTNSNTANTILTKGIKAGGTSSKISGTISDVAIMNSASKYEEWNTAAIEIYSNADVDITNCTISNVSKGIHVDNYWYDTGDITVDINGGNIAADSDAVMIYSKENAANNAAVNISSGSFSGNVRILDKTDKDNITITGGTFTVDPNDYVASGYTVQKNSDGTYKVVEKSSSSGGGTVTPTPTPDPEEPSDSEETVTNPDGSTTTTITKEDGSSSTTTVGTDGKVESDVTVSEEAVSNADGAAVALPIPEVPVTSDKDTAATVTVNLPSKEATKVEVPVKDATPGTVAVLVDADGNETVIKDTVQSENGITIELTDGATIKVVDNSKSFDDVTDNYWGADAIDFATSRELFAGTGENTFSPEGDMTRAIIGSVLARYEGADTSGASGDEWYSGPQEWAIENGISDGTMANASMTREQLAAMLYRYVGSPAVSGTVGDYSDADSISSWASDAMVWAVQEGLIAGMGENTLNPQGTATRTQVAAILQRFIENKMA